MFIFRSKSHVDLSAYLDGELGPRSARAVQESLDRSATAREQLAQLKGVHQLLGTDNRDRAVSASQERVRSRLERSLPGGVAPARGWWDRSLSIPVPIAVAAALVLGLTLPFLFSGAPRDGVSELARGAETLNLQVNVDATQTEELLQWLNERQSLEEVTIQLPDSAEFQLRGEPVLLRPGLPGEGDGAYGPDTVLTPVDPAEEGESGE